MIRRLAAAAFLAAAATVLGGCVVIQSTTWEQQDVVGDVRVTVTVCASGNTDSGASDFHPGCPNRGNSGELALANDAQLLLGLRLPDGVSAPETLAGTPAPAPPAAGQLVLRRSADYAAALTAGVPPAAGSRWVGYISDPYAFDPGASGTPAQSVALTFDLPLPPTAGGAPHVGPLAIQPVVGARSVGEDLPATRPLECGPSLYEESPAFQLSPVLVVPDTICVDAPAQIVIDNSIQIPTRDFGIVAGAATASPGQTVQIPFGVRGAGNLPDGLAAALTAATTLPGASAAPSQPAAPLANGSDTRVTVAVAIPRDAGPGVHDVTLTGRLDNGQARVGRAQLTVRDRQPPRLTGVRVKPRKLRPATRRKPRRGATVSYDLSEAASVVAAVQRCTRLARTKRRGGKRRAGKARGRPAPCVRYRTLRGRLRADGAAGANRLRFNGRLRRRPLRPGRYRLTLVATDAAGNRGKPARAAFLVPRRR